MVRVHLTAPMLAAYGLLTACAPAPDYPVTCIARTGAPGTYDYPAGVAVATVVPAAGGTQAGADAINACIRQMAGVTAQPGFDANTPVSERAGVQSGGNPTVRQPQYGNAPLDGVGAPMATVSAQAPAPAKPAKQDAGSLPLPTGYPLMAGDAELWATLTLAQQQRALLFLQDGSTIRASLRTD